MLENLLVAAAMSVRTKKNTENEVVER